MKFEHVLQIYWTKGFFFGGKLFYTNQTISSLLNHTLGLSTNFKKNLLERFELVLFLKTPEKLIITYEVETSKLLVQPLNIFFSQVNTVNNMYKDLLRLNIIRLFLIRSYRGYGHAVGKPIHGQRTWSNAWTSYHTNKTLRYFLSEMQKKKEANLINKPHNYKVLKKKYPRIKKKKKDDVLPKTLKWF